MPKVILSEIAAAQFREVHQDVMAHRHTYYWLKGGRGSTKSSFISEELPLLMLKNPLCHAVVLRKVGNTIKHSVYPQIQWGRINTVVGGATQWLLPIEFPNGVFVMVASPIYQSAYGNGWTGTTHGVTINTKNNGIYSGAAGKSYWIAIGN
ncbi:MAG: phage terminase large subunit [Anaerovibrio sp.]|nr:phage terminase large subunit [Anaerovibrio sp.]